MSQNGRQMFGMNGAPVDDFFLGKIDIIDHKSVDEQAKVVQDYDKGENRKNKRMRLELPDPVTADTSIKNSDITVHTFEDEVITKQDFESQEDA